MINNRNSCCTIVCLVGLLMLVLTGTVSAQIDLWQSFDPPLGNFAVPPNPPIEFWLVNPGCSHGTVVGGRGDSAISALQNLMPPGTGTRLVRDLNPGSGGSNITSMTHSGLDTIYHLFLSADDGSGNTGQEFYRVMGGLYPVMVLKSDINPGAVGSNPTGLAFQSPGNLGRVFFSADDGTHGRELWLSDTGPDLVSAESLVMDIRPGSESSSPEGFGFTQNATNAPMVFSADDGTNGRELWATYTTGSYPNLVNNTVLLKDINPAAGASSNPQSMTTLIFVWGGSSMGFFTADDGVNGRELWRSDGTTAGTVMLKDIVSGAGSSNPTNLTPASTTLNTALYFTVDNSLWWSKGTVGGADTLLIKDVGGAPANLTVAYKDVREQGYTLFFTVGNSLWKSNGTTAGTVEVKSFVSAPTSLFGGKGSILYFAADDGSGKGVELWKSDGTTAGTVMVKDINPGAAGSSPTNMRLLGRIHLSNSVVGFSADDGTHGRELWKTDGTSAGTVLVKDINPGAAGSDPSNLFSFDYFETLLFFTADDGTHGRELWESDGFAEATQNHVGVGYKWVLEGEIALSSPDQTAVVGTDENIFSVDFSFDFPAMGGVPAEAGVEVGLSEAAHQINHYVELTDGTDRAPLNITYVNCNDGNLPRPRAALTDGNNHNAIAFGMVAVLDQDPCDTDDRGPASPGVPFAHVPAVYDGHDWIPMDRAHFAPGLPINPPSEVSLAQAPLKWGGWDAANPPLYPADPNGFRPAEFDPMQVMRYGFGRIDVLTDYIRVSWTSKQTEITWVATLPRHYKGAFRDIHIGTKEGVQSAYPFYFDSLHAHGGVLTASTNPFGACCTAAGCTDIIGQSDDCPDGIFSPWKNCGGPTTPPCCPIPWADSDRDGSVDMDDFAALQRCLTTGGGTVSAECACFDKTGNGVIDLIDASKFANCAAGPGIALTPLQITACDSQP